MRATVSYKESSTTFATMTLTPSQWVLDHTVTELFSFTLGADASPENVAPGAQRTVTATVTNVSYEVWLNTVLGTTLACNYTYPPAASVPVTFSLDYGPGSSLSGASAATDGNGNATVIFTMGTATARVRVVAGDRKSVV